MKVHIPIRLLRIEGDGFHLLAKIRINGKNADVILDTGASKTVFDKTQVLAFVKEEKLNENERLSTGLGTASMQSHTLVIRKIEMGKIILENYNSVILDLSHVNQTYSALGLKQIVGVIGSDLFAEFKALIDYGKKELLLTVTPQKKAKKKAAPKRPVKKKKKPAPKKKK
ncbi:MAG TPA: retropepsin-like aspartic protease [Bacteroidia bacterium]|nr:retropepsin-like aspartic protease [Bacteroidia bacterium]